VSVFQVISKLPFLYQHQAADTRSHESFFIINNVARESVRWRSDEYYQQCDSLHAVDAGAEWGDLKLNEQIAQPILIC
jgi:hypothetical protein